MPALKRGGRSLPFGRGRRFLHRHTEVGRDPGQAVGVSLTDGAGLPGAVAQVDLDDDQRRLRAQPRGSEGGEDAADKMAARK